VVSIGAEQQWRGCTALISLGRAVASLAERVTAVGISHDIRRPDCPDDSRERRQ
jgi:hypothetical protein